MKRNTSIFIFIIIISAFCFSETELENLWNKAKSYNADLHAADYSIEYATSSLKNKRSLYPYTLKSNLTSAFSDIYSDIAWYTTSSNVSIAVVKANPFGNAISSGISYEIGRGVLDYFSESIDSDNIGYSHIPAFSFSMEQSLFPAFFQGIKSDPNVEILRKNILTARYSKDSVEQSLIENIAYYYIQERCTLRLLENYKKYIDYYDSRIDAAKEMLDRSQISFSEVWELENKKWEYYEDYIETLNAKENIELNLKNLCGIETAFFSPDSKLPEDNIGIFEYNPSKEKICIEIELLKARNVLDIQESAPAFTLSGTFSETTDISKSFAINYLKDKKSFNWNFSLGISFSDFFSPKNKLRKQLYKNNLCIYEEQLKILTEQTANQQENYQELINSYELQLSKIQEINRNRHDYFKDYQVLYQNGKCSRLDLEEVQLNVIESECIYKNLSDYLWFYKWKKVQCK